MALEGVRTVSHDAQTISIAVVLPWKGTVVAHVGTLDAEILQQTHLCPPQI